MRGGDEVLKLFNITNWAGQNTATSMNSKRDGATSASALYRFRWRPLEEVKKLDSIATYRLEEEMS